MIIEGYKSDENGMDMESKPLTFYYLLTLGVATSIDALTIGVTFAFLDVFILVPVITIGIVTFLISLFGVYAGKFLGSKFKNMAEIAGGLTLIGLGLKILLEHLYF
jgi:putative Mn2+ efflux pump MntP